MFDEYVLYMVENLHSQERGNELLRAVRGEQSLGIRFDNFFYCQSFEHMFKSLMSVYNKLLGTIVFRNFDEGFL